MQTVLFPFFTLLTWAEGVSSKNKAYVPPGLWEQGPPAYRDMGEDREDLAQSERYREVGTDRHRAEREIDFQEKSGGKTFKHLFFCKVNHSLFCSLFRVTTGGWNVGQCVSECCFGLSEIRASGNVLNVEYIPAKKVHTQTFIDF